MWKKLILFCTFAIFMLAVGGAVTPVWAHDECGDGGKGKHSLGHPHCVDGTTTDGSLYLVSVDGALNWEDTHTGHDGVGNKESVSVNWDFLDMNLLFLQEYFDDGGSDDGFNCFGEAPVEGRQTVLFIGQDKKGKLVASYVFSGFGTDETPGIGYRLILSLTDADDSGWRPTSDLPITELVFNKWELYNKKDIACSDSGLFSEFGYGVGTTITIELQGQD